jgi:ergothioneine biosynthesis protein EgtB
MPVDVRLVHTIASANELFTFQHQTAESKGRTSWSMPSPVVRQTAVRSSSALLHRYQAVRAESLILTAPLSPEDLMVQSCPEASPAKWHLAHTSWFFETFVLRDFLAGYQDFHPDFHWLFNSYYNSLGDMPAKSLRSSFSRPPLEDILKYRSHVDAAIGRLLESQPEYPANAEAVRRIVMGLEHEQQHQELIATDIKHALFTNPLHPAYRESAAALGVEGIAPPLEWIAFDPGLTQVGFSVDVANAESFCFDNETPRHTVYIAPFSIAARPVTCAEYLAFMDDGGYTRPELWLSDGWTTIREHGWHTPLYWQQDLATNSGWRVYTLFGWQPLDDLSETPVCHLSYFEVDAFARWASRHTPGVRLPTEFEWEFAANQLGVLVRGAPQCSELLTYALPGETSAIVASPANMLETGVLHPTRASSRCGLQQMFGDVWEWTSSAYTGYPGYRPLVGALGEYNGKFMSSQMVLRGGSCVTPATHIRASYRNFFTPGTRWQFSGLRLARDAS